MHGTPKVYKSSENGRRHFCPDCVAGLFDYNAVNLPRIAWMERAHELPAFDRYPSKG